MRDKVVSILSSVANISIEELNKHSGQVEMWDSFVMLEIVIALEDSFDIKFTQDEIAEMKTVDDICRIVEGKL